MYLDNLDLSELTKAICEKAIYKANIDLKRIQDYIDKNKSMKFKIGQIVRKTENRPLDSVMGCLDDYYVVSPFEYNPDWNSETNYYLTRLDKQTLLGVRESEIESVDSDTLDLPEAVKKIIFNIGGVKMEFASFINLGDEK